MAKRIPLELQIACKYLKKRRHGFFAFVTTLVAVGGVTIGVAAMIITLSVMNGFREEIQSKTLGIQPHVVFSGTENETAVSLASLQDRLRQERDVTASSPFVMGQILLKSKQGTQGVVVRGIIPETESQVTSIGKMLVAGSWSELKSSDDPKAAKSIFLGRELARNLTVGVGEEILAFSPTETAAIGGMGAVPKVERFEVRGIFNSGFYEYDSGLALLAFSDAQKLFAVTGASGIGLKTADLDQADVLAQKISADFAPKHWARSWQSMNHNLFKALKLEKLMMSIILTLIILVASFTIISNLILLSLEKTRDIGILRAMGASRMRIYKIFLYAGMILGFSGALAGTLLGLAGVLVISKTDLIHLPEDVYYISRLPVLLSGWDLLWVCLGAFGVAALAALYPAGKAASVEPAQAIRYGA